MPLGFYAWARPVDFVLQQHPFVCRSVKIKFQIESKMLDSMNTTLGFCIWPWDDTNFKCDEKNNISMIMLLSFYARSVERMLWPKVLSTWCCRTCDAHACMPTTHPPIMLSHYCFLFTFEIWIWLFVGKVSSCIETYACKHIKSISFTFKLKFKSVHANI